LGSITALTIDPLAENGNINVQPSDDTTRTLKTHFQLPILRVQLEQDTAKTTDLPSLLESSTLRSLINYNRASTPLIEIITPPVLTSGFQAAAAFSKIIEVLRVTGSTTGDLYNGAMRCDVNISLGRMSERTEIKNLNSVKAVRDACNFEIQSQIREYEEFGRLNKVRTTKRWDWERTIVTREKEGEKDYRYTHILFPYVPEKVVRNELETENRYMPDADLPPIILTEEYVEQVRELLPMLPDYVVSMLLGPPHRLRLDMAKRLSVNPEELQYYADVFEEVDTDGIPVYNWYPLSILLRCLICLTIACGVFSVALGCIDDRIRWLVPMLKERGIGILESPFEPRQMIDLINLVQSDIIDCTSPLPSFPATYFLTSH
jgi:aspartyl-tRNA(Asn)/glutamyl-tRNA(Gln) amidotransferase subunit B